jgi:predicted dehydrogenase
VRNKPRMEGKDVRVIQVGLGGWGRSWAGVVREATGIELVGVVDQDPEARRWASGELGLTADSCYESLDEALAATVCDAVLAITPPETHHKVVTQALSAGKHVLVEKPLAATLSEAGSLIDRAVEADRVLSVSQNYRFTRPARTVRQQVMDGVLGELISVRVTCQRDTRELFPPGNFRYLMRHPYVHDMAIHHFDLLRALTGQNVTRIYSRSWPIPDSPYQHDPAMAAIMVLEGGAAVTYEGNWASHTPETSWNGEWELVGKEGRLTWSGDVEDRNVGEVTFELWGESPRSVEQPQLSVVERAATLEQLREAVEGGEPPETNAADNMNSLAIVLGCIESIEGGGVVNITDLSASSGLERRR